MGLLIALLALGQVYPPVQADYGGQAGVYGYRLEGDSSAAVVLGNSVVRETPGLGLNPTCFELRNGPNHVHQLIQVDCGGSIVLVAPGSSLVEGTGLSGHPTVRAISRQYIVLQGALGENHDGQLEDGGVADLDAGAVMEVDGGTYYPFSTPHADVVVTSSQYREQGLMLGVENPRTGGQTDKIFSVDVWGGTGTRRNLYRAQFPLCPGFNLNTALGQHMFIGAITSTRLWAADLETYWICKSSGWVEDN